MGYIVVPFTVIYIATKEELVRYRFSISIDTSGLTFCFRDRSIWIDKKANQKIYHDIFNS